MDRRDYVPIIKMSLMDTEILNFVSFLSQEINSSFVFFLKKSFKMRNHPYFTGHTKTEVSLSLAYESPSTKS